MLTYSYISKGKFELIEKPKPVLMHERDAIVKVALASICSSDLHIKHGSEEAYGIFENKRDGVIKVAVEC